MQFDVRSPDRKRFLDAVNHRDTGEVPFNAPEFAPGIASRILGKENSCRSYDISLGDHSRLVECVGLDVCNMGARWWLGGRPYQDEEGLVQEPLG